MRIRMSVQGKEIPSFQWGSILHGVLMQKLNPDYVKYLHNSSGFKPISQYVLPTPGARTQEVEDRGLVWTIHMLGAEAIREVRPVLESERNYYLEQKNIQLNLIEVKADDPIAEEVFCSHFLLDGQPSYNPRIRYLTPSSHKSNGQYSLFPSVELIIYNLVQKWNAYAKDYSLEDKQALADIIQRTRIRNYQLRSVRYHLESINIPAYMGALEFSIRGPEPLVKLVNLLLAFAEYSGIGIKTSLGMGACMYKRS